MDGITLEVTLLIIILILLAVTLFLGVMNAIFLSKLYGVVSRQLVRPEGKKIRPHTKDAAVSEDVVISTQKVVMPPKADISYARDISDGLRIICEMNGLDALTISSTDGLALGSFGTESGVAEAARFSHLYMLGETISDPEVTVFQMDHRGSPLIGIIRSKEAVTPELSAGIENEVRRLFEKWL